MAKVIVLKEAGWSLPRGLIEVLDKHFGKGHWREFGIPELASEELDSEKALYRQIAKMWGETNQPSRVVICFNPSQCFFYCALMSVVWTEGEVYFVFTNKMGIPTLVTIKAPIL